VGSLLLAKLSVIVALSALALYLLTPTANYYWDGLAFALRIEQVGKHGQAESALFHQNHLLYNAVCYLLYLIPRSLGLSIRALSVMQVASATSCAVGVSIFFAMARRISGSKYLAVVASFLLAVSTCWWKAATDADAYSLSVALVLVCAGTLLSKHPRWYLAGASLAGAMLIHELASLFYPAALLLVLLSGRIGNRLRFALRLSVLAWGITIVSYYAVAVLIFGIGRPFDVIKWAASNPYRVQFSNPLSSLSTFSKYQLDLILGHGFKTFRLFGGAVEVSFAVVGVVAAVVAGLVTARRASFTEFAKSIWQVSPDLGDQWKRTMPGVLIWIGTYAMFLLTWEPYVLHYRVYYVPAVVLMSVLVLTNYRRRTHSTPSGAAAFAVAALFFFNLAFFIAPHMRAKSNLLVTAAKGANEKWNEHTVIYYNASSPPDTAFQYFNERTEWRGATPKAIMRLDDEIRRVYDEGGTVWLNDAAAKAVDPVWLTTRARGEEISVKLGDESYRYVQLLPTS